jgi:16S rRNA (cytosine967-C5)-methyltransferase
METHHEKEDWREAIALLVKFGRGEAHLDILLDNAHLLHSRWLVMETFRQWLLIDAILAPHLKREPRPEAHNLLRLAVAECLYRPEEDRPKVVHYAVEVARAIKLSKPEAGFVNGVLRSVLRAGQLSTEAVEKSHPQWIVQRWRSQFGEEATDRLLRWDQSIPAMYVRATEQPDYCEATEWTGYYKVQPSRSPEAIADVKAGKVYIQDPFTRIPVELLAPAPGESVLDLCAAPGGKSRLIAERLGGNGKLFLVDKPGNRLQRLISNFARLAKPGPRIIGSLLEDLEKNAAEHELQPASMDAVLIDVPCSNTGVIQKRPDVKLRLKKEQINEQAEQQLMLLELAARWVRPGGRLVYSTCSLEPEENIGVINAFCERHKTWGLAEQVLSLPWECGHDGGGAFLLTTNPQQ